MKWALMLIKKTQKYFKNWIFWNMPNLVCLFLWRHNLLSCWFCYWFCCKYFLGIIFSLFEHVFFYYNIFVFLITTIYYVYISILNYIHVQNYWLSVKARLKVWLKGNSDKLDLNIRMNWFFNFSLILTGR